jgi:hypothetical protein
MAHTASAKVVRLLSEGRVLPAGTAAHYKARGDHGEYDVVIGDGFTFCQCRGHRERGTCSHVDTARLIQDALVDGVAATVAKAGRR